MKHPLPKRCFRLSFILSAATALLLSSCTNFYYYGVPVAIVTVEAFRRAGPNPTRESWAKAMESLKDFDTGVLADSETFGPDKHVGVEKMYAVGLNAKGEETVYKTWGDALPDTE